MITSKHSSIGARALARSPQGDRRKPRDRRGRQRLDLALPARLRPFEPRYWFAEEIQIASNFTREGLYFKTPLEHYYVNMRLLVTFPYLQANRVSRQYLGKIVRLDRLQDGYSGIAVQFLF
jgi:hypothetical protein